MLSSVSALTASSLPPNPCPDSPIHPLLKPSWPFSLETLTAWAATSTSTPHPTPLPLPNPAPPSQSQPGPPSPPHPTLSSLAPGTSTAWAATSASTPHRTPLPLPTPAPPAKQQPTPLPLVLSSLPRNFDGLGSHFRLHAFDWLGTGLSGRPPFTVQGREQVEDFFLESMNEWRKKVGTEGDGGG